MKHFRNAEGIPTTRCLANIKSPAWLCCARLVRYTKEAGVANVTGLRPGRVLQASERHTAVSQCRRMAV
jgi:hypothetical protein